MSVYFFQNWSFVAQVVPVVLTWLFLRRMTRPLRVFSAFLVVSLVSTVLNSYLSLLKIHNLWASNLFMPIQFGMLAYFFSFYVGRPIQRAIRLSIPVFILVWSINFLFLESIFTYSMYAKPIEYILLAVISAIAILTNYRRNLLSPRSDPLFWIGSGALLYFSSTAILFAMSSILLSISLQALRTVLSIQGMISILINVSYSIGILCLRHQSTYSGQPS
jgi:hypothetical protein